MGQKSSKTRKMSSIGAEDSDASDSEKRKAQATEAICNAPLIHVRVQEQFKNNESLNSNPDSLANLRIYIDELIHRLCPFPGKSYHKIQVFIDWDHHIPNINQIVRVLACHDIISTQTLQRTVQETEKTIEEENLFPEFDVPNFAALVADEVYTAILDPDGTNELELHFASDWRHKVDAKLTRNILRAIEQLDIYTNAIAKRKRGDLGDPIIVGWMAPAISQSLHWAVEVWVVTEFVGYRGKALVFFVDSETLTVSRSYETEIQAS